MKYKIQEKIEIPAGIKCEFKNGSLKCTKNSIEITRKIDAPGIIVKIQDNFVILECNKGNKNHLKIIKSLVAHVENIISGLEKPFTYVLEACNVHFPMTFKVENNFLLINNFLGEKTPRTAKIMTNASIEIKGQKIFVSSSNKEFAGQTAANFEKATKIKNRDRRIFQDGLYIVQKPGDEK